MAVARRCLTLFPEVFIFPFYNYLRLTKFFPENLPVSPFKFLPNKKKDIQKLGN